VKFPALTLRAVFRIERTETGRLEGEMLRPDAENEPHPLEKIVVSGHLISFEIPSIEGRFTGHLGRDGRSLAGRLETRAGTRDAVFRRVERITKRRRPQTPKPPYPYEVEEVVFENEEDGVRLAGTLTLPGEKGRCPAVVLISGIGADDRNATVQGHKPFMVIADFLARRGVGALRFDDRGVGGSSGSLEGGTPEDVSRDALAGAAMLRRRKEVDADRVGLVGHSEGGIAATLAAATSRDIAFVVLLATPGLEGEAYQLQFEESLSRAMGLRGKALQEKNAFQRDVFAIVKGGGSLEEKRAQLQARYAALQPPPPPGLVQPAIERLLSPRMRFLLSYDPPRAIERVRCPVLSVFGGRDLQVPPPGNAEAMKRALKGHAGGRSEVRVLAGHNHFFQRASTGLPTAYGKIDQTTSPALLALLAAWIGTATDAR